MFSYLNKIGSILDEIDGSKAEAGASDEPAASSEAAEGEGGQPGPGQPSRGLGDLLAASSAGAVASGMAKAREAFTSLMTEEDEDTPQDTPQDSSCRPDAEPDVDQSWVMEETSRSRGEAFAFESEGNELPRSPETCTSREAFSEDTRHEEPVRVEALTLDSMTNSQASATVEPEPVVPMATTNGHEVFATPEVTEAPTSMLSMPVVTANGHAPVEEHFQAAPSQAAAVIPDEPVEAAFPSQPIQAAAVIPDEPVEAAFPSQPIQAAAVIPDEPVEAAIPSQPIQAAAVIPDEPVEAAFPSQPIQAAAVIPDEPVEAAIPSQPIQAATVIPDEPVEAAFPSQANGSSHLEAEAHAGFDSAQVFAAEVEEVRGEYEARLMGAAQQIGHLQGRIEELETEVANANAFVQQLTAKMASSSQQLTQQLQEQREATHRAEQAEAQVEALRKEVLSAEQRAKAKANEDSDVALGQVRQEMERELEHLLKQKDDQLRALETKLSSSERSRQSTGRDLDFAQQEVERLQGQLEQLRSESVGKSSDHQRSVEQLTLDFQSRLESLEEQKSLEARQKHELALSLRSVEERSRSDLAQLEAQRDQLELQCTALQGQLQAEQQKSVELSVSLGEAQHRMALEESQGGAAEALREAKVRELQERAQVAEEKLLEAQSMRDMFAKETEMYRNELKVSRDEKTLLEEDLKQLQERLKELNVSAKAGAGQEAVLEAVQKDFEHRMERYRDEVQYLRQKCDEKERRCEQLMAEKGALSVELRMDAGPVSSAAEDLEAGVGKSTTGKAPTGRNLMRSLPLAAPAWLRSADEPMKLVLRTLATVPAARMTFFTYVVLLHAWVLFILQQMALHPSSS